MGGAASHHENELVLDVQRLSEPAFAVNGSHQIVAWNDGAERLLGLKAEEVVGMRCYEALSTTEGALCVDCRFRCGPSVGAQRSPGASGARRAAAASKAYIAASPTERRRVNVTTLAAHTRAGQLRVVHLLHDTHEADTPPAEEVSAHATPPATPAKRVTSAAAAQRSIAAATVGDASESSGKHRRPTMLTQRELEVLRLLGAGHSTDDIARELSITRVTARNHVNKVLDKLGVNSRLQAVVIASQLQLI